VKQFCRDNPIFTKALDDKVGDAEYNPIADFYRFPKLCEAFSIFGSLKDRAKFISALTSVGIPQKVAEQMANLVN